MYRSEISEIEAKLSELRERRKLLDKKLELRDKNIAEFHAVRGETLSRAYISMQKQNEEAKNRNENFLNEVRNAAATASMNVSSDDRRSTASLNLRKCFRIYCDNVEQLLPAWRQKQSNEQLEALRNLRHEKESAARRRELARHDSERNYLLQEAIEKERRELVLSMALEQQEQLSAVAQTTMLQHEGKLIDSALLQKVENSGYELYDMMKERAESNQDRIISSLPSMLPVPIPSYPRYRQDTPPLTYNQNNADTNITQFNGQRLSKEPTDFHAYEKRSTITTGSHIDYSKTTAISMATDSYPSSVSLDLNARSAPAPTITESNGGKGVSYIQKQPQQQQQQQSHYPPYESQFLLSNGTMAQSNEILGTSTFTNLPYHEPTPTPTPSISNHRELPPALPVPSIPTQSLGSLTPLLPPVVAPPPPLALSEPIVSQQLNLNDTKINEPTLVNKPIHSDTASAPTPVTISPNNQTERGIKNHEDINSNKTVSSEVVQTINNTNDGVGVMAAAQKPLPSDHGLTTVSNSNSNSSSSSSNKTDPEKITQKEPAPKTTTELHYKDTEVISPQEDLPDTEDIEDSTVPKLLFTDMTLLQCCPLLNALFEHIEALTPNHRIRTAYQDALRTPPESSVMTRVMRAVIEDRPKELVVYGADVMAATILAVIREKGKDILPREALSGVVNVKNLQKQHKKLGGGRAEFWNCFVQHLLRLIEARRVTLDEMARIYTEALVWHVEPSEVSRIERKVSTLLQLAILPPSNEKESRPSSPATPRVIASSSSSMYVDPNATPLGSPVSELKGSLSSPTTIGNKSMKGSSATKLNFLASSATSDDLGASFSPTSSMTMSMNKPFVSTRSANNNNATSSSNNTTTPSRHTNTLANNSLSKKIAQLAAVTNITEFDEDEIVEEDVSFKAPARRRNNSAGMLTTLTASADSATAATSTTSNTNKGKGIQETIKDDEFDFF